MSTDALRSPRRLLAILLCAVPSAPLFAGGSGGAGIGTGLKNQPVIRASPIRVKPINSDVVRVNSGRVRSPLPKPIGTAAGQSGAVRPAATQSGVTVARFTAGRKDGASTPAARSLQRKYARSKVPAFRARTLAPAAASPAAPTTPTRAPDGKAAHSLDAVTLPVGRRSPFGRPHGR